MGWSREECRSREHCRRCRRQVDKRADLLLGLLASQNRLDDLGLLDEERTNDAGKGGRK